ncbi:hypothetical protein QTP70_034847 [Hemibagrus guttatus]|uniref:Uncharacterized protein n=1 Tax=Hemibagrus guttatus TaxID=175788 RepID=A0AAE0RH86_9TELE|nr:hypothetical protein QTP70_034847 [Hemibagrus guttatus]
MKNLHQKKKKNLHQEEGAGVFTTEGPGKISLLSLMPRVRGGRDMDVQTPDVPPEPDAVRSSARACLKCMSKPTEMEDDEELESAVLNISPSKLQLQLPSAALSVPPPDTKQLPPVDAPASPAQKTPVPLPKELVFLVPEQSTKRPVSTAEEWYSVLTDCSTVISSPVCRTPAVEECGKDENLSFSETTSYSVPHTAETSHAKVSLRERWLLSPLFFYQQGPIRYFYGSTKVFKAYSAEGLKNPRMPFQDFMDRSVVNIYSLVVNTYLI